MAIEKARACGYRQVGGLYLESDPGPAMVCDRLPLPITACEVCGAEPRFSRAIARIDPYTLWGLHMSGICQCPGACPCCNPLRWPLPPEAPASLLMWVGSEYTAESFIAEGVAQGISKRIHVIPKGLVVGQSWVYLAKLRIIPDTAQGWIPGLTGERAGYGPGVFYAFRPRRIVKVLTESMAGQHVPNPETGAAGDTVTQRELYERQGLTVLIVPDDDPDHNPQLRQKAGTR